MIFFLFSSTAYPAGTFFLDRQKEGKERLKGAFGPLENPPQRGKVECPPTSGGSGSESSTAGSAGGSDCSWGRFGSASCYSSFGLCGEPFLSVLPERNRKNA